MRAPARITTTHRPDGQTAIIGHLRPPPGLIPWLEALWYSEGPLDALREHVLPAATADLVFNLGPDMRLLEGNGDAAIRGATVSGMLLQPILLEHPPIHRALGLRLRPDGLRALLHVPPRVALDQSLPLDALLGPIARSLCDQLADTRDPALALDLALDWALSRAARSQAPDPVTRWTASRIEQAHGAVSITSLQQESGYGATRFIARFKEELGMTPKTYARILRFRRALDLLRPDLPLAQLALDTGFSDQPHMHAEFQRLAHHTPAQILATRYPSGLTLAHINGV